jgi:hypothetical protein
MAKIGLMDKGSDQLAARSSVAGTDRIPVFTSTGTEPELATVDQIAASASGLLDNDNTWTGTNDFTGGISIDSTEITATGDEINRLDDSAEVETIDSGEAVSTTKFNTNIDNTTSGAGAVTLDVCPASMVGKNKTIRFAVDNGNVTLALTNVQGGTAATTATFADVGDELILVGSAGGKWTVIKEFGVTLS